MIVKGSIDTRKTISTQRPMPPVTEKAVGPTAGYQQRAVAYSHTRIAVYRL
jgi:hypothetical protein